MLRQGAGGFGEKCCVLAMIIKPVCHPGALRRFPRIRRRGLNPPAAVEFNTERQRVKLRSAQSQAAPKSFTTPRYKPKGPRVFVEEKALGTAVT